MIDSTVIACYNRGLLGKEEQDRIICVFFLIGQTVNNIVYLFYYQRNTDEVCEVIRKEFLNELSRFK